MNSTRTAPANADPSMTQSKTRIGSACFPRRSRCSGVTSNRIPAKREKKALTTVSHRSRKVVRNCPGAALSSCHANLYGYLKSLANSTHRPPLVPTEGACPRGSECLFTYLVVELLTIGQDLSVHAPDRVSHRLAQYRVHINQEVLNDLVVMIVGPRGRHLVSPLDGLDPGRR